MSKRGKDPRLGASELLTGCELLWSTKVILIMESGERELRGIGESDTDHSGEVREVRPTEAFHCFIFIRLIESGVCATFQLVSGFSPSSSNIPMHI